MRVAPTQSNLLKLKRKLEITEEGYGLLDEKREVMIMELMRNIRGFKEMEEEVTQELKEAYGALEKAWVYTGREKIENSIGDEEEVNVEVRFRSVMGIPVPEFLLDVPSKKVQASLDSTDEYFDDAFIRFREIIEVIAKWAEKEILIWRLGSEISKTQKRVNALEKIFIPQYKEDISRIEDSLEEEEREAFFRMKRLKRGEK